MESEVAVAEKMPNLPAGKADAVVAVTRIRNVIRSAEAVAVVETIGIRDVEAGTCLVLIILSLFAK